MVMQMVNNRQYSRTTIQTVSTRSARDSPRRPSLESRDTQQTVASTVHPHVDVEGPSRSNDGHPAES